MYVRARVKELEAELAKKAVAPAPDRLMRKLLMKAEAEAAELQRKLDVKTTDLLNSQDKRASTARAPVSSRRKRFARWRSG